MFSYPIARRWNSDEELLTGSFFILGFSVPYSVTIVRYAIILFALVVVIVLGRRRNLYRNFQNVGAIHFLIPVLFIIYSISLLHPMPYAGWLERGWMLIVFPVLFISLKENLQKIYPTLLKGVVCGAIGMGLINLIYATVRSVQITNNEIIFDSSAWGGVPFLFSIDHYGNYYFSNWFSTFSHPTYAALVVTISSAAVLIFNPFKWTKGTVTAVSIFNLLIIGLLSSRAAFVGVVISLFIMIFSSFGSLSKNLKKILAVVLIISAFAFYFHPRIKNIISSGPIAFKENTRVISWRCALESAHDNWMFGVGIDRVQAELSLLYSKYNYESHLKMEYNAHNQFLETLLGTGVSGLILLILIFFYGFKISLNHQDLFGIIILINILIHFIFESMLVRFHGVLIFSLFVPLLFLMNEKNFSKKD